MHMNWLTDYLGYTAGAVLAILPIVNPLGAVPLVMTVAAHLPEQERQRQIRRACLYTFFLMTGFLVAGSRFRMLFPGRTVANEVADRGEVKYDIAFTPLAMPGLSGPGTFAVVMSLSSRAGARQGWDQVVDFIGVATGILLVALLSWFTLRGAERFHRLLGETGMVAMTRLMGFLMICIGVQFIINGLMVITADPAIWSGLAEAVRQAQP